MICIGFKDCREVGFGYLFWFSFKGTRLGFIKKSFSKNRKSFFRKEVVNAEYK